MANGKYEPLREQIAKLREQSASIRTENIAQTKSIDKLADVVEKHEASSQIFRSQCDQNKQSIQSIHKETIPPIRKALYGLYGLLGAFLVAGIAALVKYILTK